MTADDTVTGLPAAPMSPVDLLVLSVISMWPCPPAPTLDCVCAALSHLPREQVFASVARLEDRRLLRWGAVR